jgi:hypothetical protein
MLLVQLGTLTWFAAQSLGPQQLPDAVDTQVPGAPVPDGHSLVFAGHAQVPPAALQTSPLMFRIRTQSAFVQHWLLAMQLLLPAH